MLDDERVFRRGTVEEGESGMPPSGQNIVVIVPRLDPLARRHGGGPKPRGDFLFRGSAIQRDLQEGKGSLGKMAVGVEKGGHQRRAVQRDVDGIWGGGAELFQGGHGRNPSLFHQHGIPANGGIHAHDGATGKQ